MSYKSELQANNIDLQGLIDLANTLPNKIEGITPSGTKEITANGEYDVTDYAKANVVLPVKTIYIGTSAPSASIGSDGDFYIVRE